MAGGSKIAVFSLIQRDDKARSQVVGDAPVQLLLPFENREGTETHGKAKEPAQPPKKKSWICSLRSDR